MIFKTLAGEVLHQILFTTDCVYFCERLANWIAVHSRATVRLPVFCELGCHIVHGLRKIACACLPRGYMWLERVARIPVNFDLRRQHILLNPGVRIALRMPLKA